MKASDLQILYKYISLCDSPFDYISMLQMFLLDIGILEAKEYGIKRIFYESINLLSKEFNIHEVKIKEKHNCNNNGVKTKSYNLSNILYNFDFNSYQMDDSNFIIKLSEPKFDLDTVMDDTKVFIDGIKYIEFENGELLTLNEMSSEELEVFMKMIDLDIYNNLNNLMDSELHFIKTEHCEECGLDESCPSDEYLEVLILLLQTILEVE